MAAELPDDGESDQDEEGPDDEEVERMRLASQKRGIRCSVAAESTCDIRKDFVPPKNEKSAAQAEQLKAALLKSFMFSTLPPENLSQVIDAFEGPIRKMPGEDAIRQGDLVDSGEPALFIIESGRLDVLKTASDAPDGRKIFSYDQMGQSFGELALLYNCPRAATVRASSESVLWAIDRDTFNFCVKEGYRLVRERHERFIQTVDVLKEIGEEERLKIVDVLQLRHYKRGEHIIRAGEEGLEFFMVEQGRCVATKGEKTVMEYGPNEYFGELALLNKQVRAANVTADATPTVCAVLDQGSFLRLIGPQNACMLRRAKEYGVVETESGTRAKAIPSPGNDCKKPDDSGGGGGLFESLLGPLCFCSSLQKADAEKTVKAA